RPDAPDPLAEPLDEAVADRDRGEQRDLLRRDRGDEPLERVRRERGPEAGEADDERREQLVACGPGRERDEVEVEAEQPADDELRLRVERVDVDAAVRRRDPHLASADRAVERAVLPEARAVEPEGAEARRRQLERERLRGAQQRHRKTLAAASPPEAAAGAVPSGNHA